MTDFDEFVSFYPNKSVLMVDFPPFGKSDKSILDWNIFTYAGMLMSLCEHLSIEKADFLGHSFGGRIAIIISAVKRSLVRSLVLVDSAGMKPRRKIRYYFRLFSFKIRRYLHLKTSGYGSKDYMALSPEMQQTFKSIVGTYLEVYAKKIFVPTLIVWGKKDKETPLYMAKRLNRLIKDSRLEIIDNGGHFSFLDCPLEFFSIVYQFLEE